jgi:hypothetical protein
MQLQYAPGSCNIGPEEIARRERVARVGLLAAAAFVVAFVAFGVHGVPRMLVAIPLASAAIGWIQARRHFCLAYGFAGTFNLGKIGDLHRVVDAAALAADRRTASLIALQGLVLGLAGAVLITIAPLG